METSKVRQSFFQEEKAQRRIKVDGCFAHLFEEKGQEIEEKRQKVKEVEK